VYASGVQRDGQREGDEGEGYTPENDQPAVERIPHDPDLLVQERL
jgi:hypothetical protein